MSKAYFKRIEAKYMLTQAEFLKMLVDQGSLCASCKRQLVLFSSVRAERPVVDHCHIAEKMGYMVVRGLVCTRCNTHAGYMEKDLARTVDVLKYLVRWSPKGRFDALAHPIEQGRRPMKKRHKPERRAEILRQLDALDALAEKVLDRAAGACNTQDAGLSQGLRAALETDAE